MNTKINIAIAGYKAHASRVFDALKKVPEFEISAVFTSADDCFCLLGEKSIYYKAKEAGIPVFSEKNLTREHFVSFSKTIKIDLLLLVEWKNIIPERTFSFPEYGTYNIHDSLLPKYRGSSPMNWAIINGEPVSGATFYRITRRADNGPIFSQKKFKIGADDYAIDVLKKVLDIYVKVAIAGINNVINAKKPLVQNEQRATYCVKRFPHDGLLNFNTEAVSVYNTIRALSYPFPGAYAFYRGAKFTITKASLVKERYDFSGLIPGHILKNKDIWVLCSKGILKVLEIETLLNGKKITDPKKFFLDNSFRINDARTL